MHFLWKIISFCLLTWSVYEADKRYQRHKIGPDRSDPLTGRLKVFLCVAALYVFFLIDTAMLGVIAMLTEHDGPWSEMYESKSAGLTGIISFCATLFIFEKRGGVLRRKATAFIDAQTLAHYRLKGLDENGNSANAPPS